MSNQSLEELKLPLIVADYRTYFDASTRVYDQMAKYRQWEIALVTILSLFLGRYASVGYFVIVPVLFLIGIFWALDARSRLLLDRINELAVKAERELSAGDEKTLKHNIKNWVFGNTSAQRTPAEMTVRRLVKRMTVRSLTLLHGSLAVFAIFLFLISGNVFSF